MLISVIETNISFFPLKTSSEGVYEIFFPRIQMLTSLCLIIHANGGEKWCADNISLPVGYALVLISLWRIHQSE